MPTYQYRCTECGEDLEAVQKFSDAPLETCPTCGGTLRKVFNAVGVVFKGSGFYRTDSRTSEKSGSGDGSSSTKESTSSGSSDSSDSSGSSGSSGSGSQDSSSSKTPASTGSSSSGSSSTSD